MRVQTAAILAGGAGTRLGGIPKETIEIGGGPAGPRLARILASRFRRVLVVTRNPDLYAGTGATTLPDLFPGFGPLSGLHAALSASEDELLWLAACDMPAFDPRLVELLESWLPTPEPEAGPLPLASLCRHGTHFEPFQAIYSRRCVARLEWLFASARKAPPESSRSILQPSFKELFAGEPVVFVPEAKARALSPDWGLFFNINTPEDLRRLSPALASFDPS